MRSRYPRKMRRTQPMDSQVALCVFLPSVGVAALMSGFSDAPRTMLGAGLQLITARTSAWLLRFNWHL